MFANFPHLSFLVGLGFLLGLRHAFDADHIVAISTLVSQTRSFGKSSLFGVAWCVGHTLTLLVAALVVLVFHLSIPPSVAQFFEFGVGLLLLLLGASVIIRSLRGTIHIHAHHHADGRTHLHLHAHDQGGHHGQVVASSLLVGVVHGLAGSGALVLLILSSVRSVGQGVFFVFIFGVGSLLGMFLTTTALAMSLRTMTRLGGIQRHLQLGTGVLSVLFGLVIMVQIGFQTGLSA